MRLDNGLIKQFTEENYKKIFNSLVETKTDKYNGQIKLPMGVDGNKRENIEKNIKQFSKSFCCRALSGKYIFSPFREMQVPKAPYTKFEFKEAKKNDKLRTLAISTINDTIFQKMIYNAVYDYTEKRYEKLDENIYGYRKGKSVKQAIEKIQQYFSMGYVYGVDGDIEKYFDMIDHERLKKKIGRFYKNDPLIVKYLSRFIKVKRVPIENKKAVGRYFNEKPNAVERTQGIPQGGVLSGLLANLYLYNFDKYVVGNLGQKFDIKYIRYADDFIVLCKDKNIIMELYRKLRIYLQKEKLKLHLLDSSAIDGSLPNKNKTKAINLDRQYFIEFLGFKISTKYLGIKRDNIKKFKKVIRHIVDVGLKERQSIHQVIYKMNAKLLGNWIYGRGYFVPCEHCGKAQKPQSWIGFFINITDMRQLKSLDVWIRKKVRYFCRARYRVCLSRKYFRHSDESKGGQYYNYNIVSLFQECCYIKNYMRKHKDLKFCECEQYIPYSIYEIS